MIVRASQLFLPTLRDAPADAEAVSHKLLVRAGYIRQVSAGLWSFAPLGWRVHRKVEQIIREEMEAIGSQEWFAPVLTPLELWEATGRDKIVELFRLEDRVGRKYILPLTHEETFTFHAREIQSYKQLPQSWYHFQTKDRDEPRPRSGLIRVREFIMKDSYSFDRDEAGLDVELPRARGRLPPDLPALRPRVPGRAGGVGDDGRQRVDRLPRAVGRGREHARHVRERRLRGRSRDRLRGAASTRVPAEARRAGGDRDTGRHDDRGARGAARHRRGGDVEGDAAHEGGRHRRARARARRRPARAREARRRPQRGRAPVDRGRDPRRVRRRPRIARPGRLRRPDRRRRDPARRPVRRRREPDGLPPARRRGGPRLPGGLRRPARAGRKRPLPELRRRAALPDRDRDRPHLQARHALLGSRSTRRSSTRTARRRRWSWAATASAPAGSWPRRSSSSTTTRASAGRRRSRRTTCTSSCCRAPRSRARRPRASSPKPGATCCSTTAPCARARSSPTRT